MLWNNSNDKGNRFWVWSSIEVLNLQPIVQDCAVPHVIPVVPRILHRWLYSGLSGTHGAFLRLSHVHLQIVLVHYRQKLGEGRPWELFYLPHHQALVSLQFNAGFRFCTSHTNMRSPLIRCHFLLGDCNAVGHKQRQLRSRIIKFFWVFSS